MKTNMKTKLTSLLCVVSICSLIKAQDIIVNDNVGSGDVYWNASSTYHLNGGVFVEAGTTLHIEAGTVIKGIAGQGEAASYLCVARDGIIMANGTSSAPIIFTFEADPLDGSTPITTRGQWGGLIVLGNAGLNSTPGVSAIEGIPTTELRGQYGGLDDTDNSGVISYVSIRHGGIEIGAGNEINGLTLAGVGSGTDVNHIEVISNTDDGIELFGGTVSVQFAFVSACGDDSFDYDEGWRGQLNSNWISVASADDGDRGGEHDGGTDPEAAMPFANPTIDGAIFVGRGIDAGKRALTFRDNAGGHYSNSIFYNFAKGIDIEDLEGIGEDSYSRFLNGDLSFTNNVVDCGSAILVSSTGTDLSNYFIENGNTQASNHGIYWSSNLVNMGGHTDWASWTLAMTSGWVIPGEQVSIDLVSDVEVAVYPNPVLGSSIKVIFEEYQTGNITLTNSLGQLIYNSDFEGTEKDISSFTNEGLYFLKIKLDSGELILKKIIK